MKPLIAPIIPTTSSASGSLHNRPGGGSEPRRLPTADVRKQPLRAHLALRPVDSRGRITDRGLAVRMGWQPGQRLQWRFDGDVIVLSPHEQGGACVNRAGYLWLSARCCQAASASTGDRLLFVARIGATDLILIPPSVIDEMVTAHLAGIAELGGVS